MSRAGASAGRGRPQRRVDRADALDVVRRERDHARLIVRVHHRRLQRGVSEPDGVPRLVVCDGGERDRAGWCRFGRGDGPVVRVDLHVRGEQMTVRVAVGHGGQRDGVHGVVIRPCIVAEEDLVGALGLRLFARLGIAAMLEGCVGGSESLEGERRVSGLPGIARWARRRRSATPRTRLERWPPPQDLWVRFSRERCPKGLFPRLVEPFQPSRRPLESGRGIVALAGRLRGHPPRTP